MLFRNPWPKIRFRASSRCVCWELRSRVRRSARWGLRGPRDRTRARPFDAVKYRPPPPRRRCRRGRNSCTNPKHPYNVAAGAAYVRQSTFSGNSATGGLGGDADAWPGPSYGGGLNIAPSVPPLADLDAYTESNTVNNFADIDPNIAGSYTLNGVHIPPLVIGDVSTLEGNSGTTAFVFTVSLATSRRWSTPTSASLFTETSSQAISSSCVAASDCGQSSPILDWPRTSKLRA